MRLSLGTAGAVALAFGVAMSSAAPLKVMVGKHGETHADLRLQNDVNDLMHRAVPVLVERAKGPAAIACEKMTRVDTVVTKMVTNDQWSETWTYVVCDTQIAIPIDFVPSPQGGTDFTLRSKDVVVGPAPKQ